MGASIHAEKSQGPPDGLPATPMGSTPEWRLWQWRTTLALLRAAAQGEADLNGWLQRHPTLHRTLAALAALGLADLTLDEALARLDARLDDAAPAATPLSRLRCRLGLDADGLSCFVLGALADAEPTLAALVDELHGQGGRPTRATLQRVFGGTEAAALRALRAAGGLVAQHGAWAVPPVLWDLACGLPPLHGAWTHTPAAQLRPASRLVLPADLAARLQTAMQDTAPACWLLRGVPGSGRRALAGALAQAHGLGLLELHDAVRTHTGPHAAPPWPDDPATLTGAAATLLGALPLLNFDPAPGEGQCWPVSDAAPPRLAVRLPRHGGLAVEGRPCRRIELGPPAAEERRRHWRAALGGDVPDALVGLRLPRGTLHRVAQSLRAAGRAGEAADAVDGGPAAATAHRPPGGVGGAHTQAGAALVTAALDEVDALGRHALDGLARRVPPAAAGETLALPETAQDEFSALLARCRHRDRIAAALPGTPPGVRALFKGPSGTGKTLAARQLAAALQRPLYRVDLAATVSKYIGETERNLERVFEAAEALDIVLLLDEGDALLAGRTGVANATDRYANLETNYLLQRLEHFSGVLVVTTNAAERIDTAFARRMDVSIEFPLPDAHTRLKLWLAHLGARAGLGAGADAHAHAVPDDWLDQVALRCTLSGGQIRNAVLHATLLALDSGHPLGAHELQRAVEREYRKAGQQCPTLAVAG